MLEITLYGNDGKPSTMSLPECAKWIASDTAKEFFAEGGHAEVWSNKDRPFDEYPNTVKKLKQLVWRTLAAIEE